MNLSKLVAASGYGIFRMVTNKSNGLIVEDLKDGKRQFISVRQSNFTPLESIFIFVDNADVESVPLKDVFIKMLENIETIPVPAVKSPDQAFKSYLAAILPDYDRDRVYVSDMKKLIKWFTFLNDAGALSLEDDKPKAETTEAAAAETTTEVVAETLATEEPKPKKKAPAKKKAE